MNREPTIARIVSRIEEGDDPDMYGGLAPLYDWLFKSPTSHDDQFGLVHQYAPTHPDGIIEGGCGTGRLLQRLSNAYPYADVVGLDINVEMVDIARYRTDSRKHVSVKQADLRDFTLPTTDFDVGCILGNTLSHLADDELEAAFSRFNQHLKSDGHFLVEFASPEDETNGSVTEERFQTERYDIAGRITTFLQPDCQYTATFEIEDRETGELYYTGREYDINFHTRDVIRRELNKAGFTVKEYRPNALGHSGVIVANPD